MKMKDMILSLDQMKRNNREYSRQHDRDEDCQREDEAADLLMKILHKFELAGMKSVGEAIAVSSVYPALYLENKTKSYENAKMKYEIEYLESEILTLTKLLRSAGMALSLSCDSADGKPTPEGDLDKILLMVSEAVDEMRRSAKIQKTE